MPDKRKPIRVAIGQTASGKFVAKWGSSTSVHDSLGDAHRSLVGQASKKHRRLTVDTAGTKPGLEVVKDRYGRKAARGYAVALTQEEMRNTIRRGRIPQDGTVSH
jgi:predicted SPOUT superfamily RNA methylase MTH1